jgi:cation transport regulator
MPYQTTRDLPKHLREHLPEFAQEIYRTAYNAACNDYADPAKYRDFGSLEEVAHHIAWAAVKKEIEKDRKKSQRLGWASSV